MCSGTTRFSTRYGWRKWGCSIPTNSPPQRASRTTIARPTAAGTDSQRGRGCSWSTRISCRTNDRPSSIVELADPKWKGRCGLAKPLFGTTATHAAVLFAHWGNKRAQEYFAAVKGNARVLSGNKQVAVAVGQGQLAFGVTDTDDAISEVEKGLPVAIVYPDQGAGEMGTLFIPNTLSILRGAPHPGNARRLLDYLLTAEIETRLAQGAKRNFPCVRTFRENRGSTSRTFAGWMWTSPPPRMPGTSRRTICGNSSPRPTEVVLGSGLDF